MASPSVVNHTTATAETATSITVNVPSGGADGNLLVLFVSNRGASTWTTLAGWTERESQVGSGNARGKIWTRTASSEPASYTVSWTSSFNAVATMVRVSGHDGYDVSDSTVAGSATTAPDSPSITTSQADTLCIWTCGSQGTATRTVPSGTTGLTDLTVGGGGSATGGMCAYSTEASGNTGVQTWTTSASTASWTGSIAIKPTASGVTGTGTLTEGSETPAATGAVNIAGTGGITEGGEASAATGIVNVSGSGTLNESAETIAATGTTASTALGTVPLIYRKHIWY